MMDGERLTLRTGEEFSTRMALGGLFIICGLVLVMIAKHREEKKGGGDNSTTDDVDNEASIPLKIIGDGVDADVDDDNNEVGDDVHVDVVQETTR